MRLSQLMPAALLATALALTLAACADDGKEIARRDYVQFLRADRVLYDLCATPAERRRVSGPSIAGDTSHLDQRSAVKLVMVFDEEYDDRDYRVGEGNEKHRVGPMLDAVERHLRRCRPALADQIHAGPVGKI